MSADEVPDTLLRSALEFAVGVAAASASMKPAVSFPAGLKPFLRVQRLSPVGLRAVREALEGDAEFRTRLAALASQDLVDDVGRLWLGRPPEWEQQLAVLASSAADDEPEGGAASLRRAERRREAAERSAFRAQAEIAALRDEVERGAVVRREAGATIAALRQAGDDLRAELGSARRELAQLQAAARSAATVADAANQARDAAVESARAAEASRDRALRERAAHPAPKPPSTPSAPGNASAARALEQAAAACAELARSLAGAAAALADVPAPRVPAGSGRRPIAIPGGTYGDSRAATEHLLRAPNVVSVLDGYNVAKLGWPDLPLHAQRERCISAAELVARRWGTDTVVIFDGADVPGASTTARRLVRVVFSPPGVSADDVIRREVAGLPGEVPVVVVTNDQAILADVRGMGANVVSSDRWLDIALG